MVPPVAVHVTAVLELPVTVAVNCWVCPGCNVALVGETVTPTDGCTVTCAVADLVESATEVAVTVKLEPAVFPAVNKPAGGDGSTGRRPRDGRIGIARHRGGELLGLPRL